MLRMLESQAPAKQTATDTINTLSNRLQSATLLEDRRAAILGLRSFAKLYPASVASGALRDLISCLRKDVDDSDTTNLVVETLLWLFTPDEKSTEASEEIALWLADEFTQRQDNITVLLDLLESREPLLTLHSLQLISHIALARPGRTQECVMEAPLGVSRMVTILDDKREVVRNEALLLLIALTPSSTVLQKLVAYENVFDRIFTLIDAEGSLTHGSTIIQDCLSLLSNLLRLNTSNQSLFRESGCISKVTKLLADVSKEEDSADGVSEWAKPQRDKNIWGLLSIVQLFVVKGGQGTPANQKAFWKSGLIVRTLQLAFRIEFDAEIRAKCLRTCADLIRGNSALQEQFGDLAVPKTAARVANGNGRRTPADKQDRRHLNGHSTPKEATPRGSAGPIHEADMTNVIEALLKLSLEAAPLSVFDVRLAACECMKAFFFKHVGIRNHVLRRAIEGFKNGDDEIPNILTVMVSGSSPDFRSMNDPYQTWMASMLLFHLLYENLEAKEMALGVTEGDASNGEEVITCIQGIAGNLIAGVQRGDDPRVLIGYLILLSGWLFEDPDSVNDFLGEGSSLQSLISTTRMVGSTMPLVSGLCAFLLGTIYEFSSKDSPVPRATIHDLLITGLGRETFMDCLTRLRESMYVRDFEVLLQGSNSNDGGLPNVFFDQTFIDFLKDNFSRILRAIDRDPEFEISVIANGVQKGISRELVDSLRAQVDDRSRAVQDLESEMLLLKRKFEQEELDHRRTRESSAVEVGRIKQINESLHRNHDEELMSIEEQQAKHNSSILQQHQEEMNSVTVRLRQTVAENDQKTTLVRQRNDAEIADLRNMMKGLETQLSKSEKDHAQDLLTAHEEYAAKVFSLEARGTRAEERVKEADERAQHLASEVEYERLTAQNLKSQVEEREVARKDVQTELDDLLVVFADLETKRAEDKNRLKKLGESVSEDEDDDEAEAEAEAEDVDE